MRRHIVLCVIFLSVLSFPGNASAIIIGEVWSTGALSSAQNPALGPPKSVLPDATFEVMDINFDSRLIKDNQERSLITYNQFLNDPTKWDNSMNPALGLKPGTSMFPTSEPNQGIFFRFTMSLQIPAGPLPVTITHDDGFYFSIFNAFAFGPKTSDPVTGPVPTVTRFDVKGFDPGTYPATINYGALNDSADHVLIYNTPEPWTILLLGLGMLGLGILRRKI